MKVLHKGSAALHHSFHHHRSPLKNKQSNMVGDLKEQNGMKTFATLGVDNQKERLLQQQQFVLHQSYNNCHNINDKISCNHKEKEVATIHHFNKVRSLSSTPSAPTCTDKREVRTTKTVRYFTLPHNVMTLLKKSEDYDDDDSTVDDSIDNHSIDSDQENKAMSDQTNNDHIVAGCTKHLDIAVKKEAQQNDLLQLQQSNSSSASLSLEEEAIIDTSTNLKKETTNAAYSSPSILLTVSDDDDENDEEDELLQSNHSTLFSESFASSMDDLVDNTVDTINNFCVASSPKSFPTL